MGSPYEQAYTVLYNPHG